MVEGRAGKFSFKNLFIKVIFYTNSTNYSE